MNHNDLENHQKSYALKSWQIFVSALKSKYSMNGPLIILNAIAGPFDEQ